VARSPEELAVLEQYAAGGASVSLLTRDEILERVPVAPDAVGGAFLPRDLQVNPREAAPAIAGWLADQGVDFLWRTAALGIETGRVLTSRGILTADAVVVATGHDIDELFPEMAERVGLSRCRLHMVRARVGLRFPLRTPLFTGWSLLRYSGFAGTDAATTLRERLAADLPDGIAHDLNQMYTPQADGTLLIGDTHDRALDAEPFQSEAGFDLLLDQTRRLFGAGEIEVVERWQGVYASAPHQEFLIESPLPGVTVVTVTTGIGMTTALGVAPHVLAGAPLPL
jgi:FAD dependent oxidoreductase TIGR03364